MFVGCCGAVVAVAVVVVVNEDVDGMSLSLVCEEASSWGKSACWRFM